MNNDPRFYLSARRPHGQDDADPAIGEALQAAARDPRLEAWSKDEQRIDAAVAKRLADVSPPLGLRERILAGAELSRRRWKWWPWKRATFDPVRLVGVAAMLMLLGIILTLSNSSKQVERQAAATVVSWQEAAAQEVALIEKVGSTDPLDHVVSDLPSIRAWLTEQTCPTPAALPAPVQKLSIFGCAKRSWKGQPLSIVCFAFDKGREVHLVTIDRRHLPSSPPEGAPEFGTVQGYQTASWSEGEVAMMLIGKVERNELERLFSKTADVRGTAPQGMIFAFAGFR